MDQLPNELVKYISTYLDNLDYANFFGTSEILKSTLTEGLKDRKQIEITTTEQFLINNWLSPKSIGLFSNLLQNLKQGKIRHQVWVGSGDNGRTTLICLLNTIFSDKVRLLHTIDTIKILPLYYQKIKHLTYIYETWEAVEKFKMVGESITIDILYFDKIYKGISPATYFEARRIIKKLIKLYP